MILSLAFAGVGAVIASRVPKNRIGLLFCRIGFVVAVTTLPYQYANYGLTATGERLQGAKVGAWLYDLGEIVAPLFALALLLFPDGHLPSRRWRAPAGVVLLSMTALLVSDLFRPGPLDNPFPSASNPVGIAGTRAVLKATNTAGWLLAIAGIALGGASMVARRRRARGIQRQQLKLVLAVGAVVAAVAALTALSWFVWRHGGLSARMSVIGIAFAAFPITAGVAVLRYRLYDVDVVVNRTLVYAALTVALSAAWGATALVVGTAFGGSSGWTTAAATLVAAVAFRPLRGRLQDEVDRRFNRARYDALRQMQAFLDGLRAGRRAPEEIEEVLRAAVAEPRLKLLFYLPESELYVDATGLAADLAHDDRERVAVERAGKPLALVLHSRSDDRDPTLLPRVVQAGGLAIEIARLRVELRRQLNEVEESRARIVEAADSERRRIERDLHDGAQQRLVSIGLALRHAQHLLAGASPERAGETLEGAVAEAELAIEELRELAHGLPPAQLDRGLAPALRELAERAPFPVELRVTSQRFAPAVEAAGYFIACEAVTNSVKHAQASKVLLTVSQENGNLIVRVADNGIGGVEPNRGSGLAGLYDRVNAQGGKLRVESHPGQGTRLTAELPCES